jgi:sorbitol/mannitol transport system permease protein
VMFFFLSTKFLPAVAGLLPLYIIAKTLGLLDNISFIVILYTAMNLPIAVWMLRSFLADIPVELFEAASIDGAGLVRTLRSIIVPIISPGIAATALICFIFSWNELFLANRLASGVIARTAPVYLGSFITGEGLFAAKLAAAAVIVSAPVLIAGFAAQDKLVQGLSLGAVK